MKGAGMPSQPYRLLREIRLSGVSGFTIEEIKPRLFSFNSPQGACPTCDGIGEKQLNSTNELVVPNERTLTLKQGADCTPWAKSNPPSPYYMQVLTSAGEGLSTFRHRPRRGTSWSRASSKMIILHGTQGGMPVTAHLQGRAQGSYDGQQAVRGCDRQPQPQDDADRERVDAARSWASSRPRQPCEDMRWQARLKRESAGGEDWRRTDISPSAVTPESLPMRRSGSSRL